MPSDIGVVDLMVGVPDGSGNDWHRKYQGLLLDAPSRGSFQDAVGYMFKDMPRIDSLAGYIPFLLEQMDRHGIRQAMLPVQLGDDDLGRQAVERHPERFFGSFHIDPNRGMDGVRELARSVRELGVKAATAFPCGYLPQVPIDDQRMYPFYARCIELDIPMCINAGVPGPRMPMAPQRVELLDEVCRCFPELRLVTRHGCEPWTKLAVELMLEHANLYYSTSAFAPRHYPRDIVEFANGRGADKVMYAGYFPSGLSFERSFAELPGVPLDEAVWPRFLRDNARRVFRLEA